MSLPNIIPETPFNWREKIGRAVWLWGLPYELTPPPGTETRRFTWQAPTAFRMLSLPKLGILPQNYCEVAAKALCSQANRLAPASRWAPSDLHSGTKSRARESGRADGPSGR
jgi:hypothetical protein